MKTAIVLSLLIISTLSTDCARYKISTNKTCGPKHGNTYCAAYDMCSRFGKCGRSYGFVYKGQSNFNFYRVPKICRDKAAHQTTQHATQHATQQDKCQKYKLTRNGKCGPSNSYKYCTPGKSCSNYGWCGKGEGYISAYNDKYDYDKIPKECLKHALNDLETEENVNLFGINPNYEGSKRYSGEYMLCAFIIGLFVVYLTFKIFSTKNSKDNGDFRFEVTPIVLAE